MPRRVEPREQGVREMAFKQREEGPKAPSPAAKPSAPASEKPVKSAPKSLPERLMSLDAYRGFTMLLMVSGGWGITSLVQKNPEMLTEFDGRWYGKPWKLFWNTAAWQLDHVAWTGCVAWDLIQPAFMFMVGVAMPFSYAKREARGDSWGVQFGHALIRSLILIGLGIFLRSTHSSMTYFTFEDVLTQIGLGYIFVFVLLRAPFVAQLVAVLVILGGYWFAFYRYPLPPPDGNAVTRYLTEHGAKPEAWNQFTDAGLKPTGLAPHWNKHTNAAAAADRVFLNLFPRVGEPWEGKKFWVNGGGSVDAGKEARNPHGGRPGLYRRCDGDGHHDLAVSLRPPELLALPDRQANLDAVVGRVQHRLGTLVPWPLLLGRRHARPPSAGVSVGDRRHELDPRLLRGSPLGQLAFNNAADPPAGLRPGPAWTDREAGKSPAVNREPVVRPLARSRLGDRLFLQPRQHLPAHLARVRDSLSDLADLSMAVSPADLRPHLMHARRVFRVVRSH
jgi:hypothetical protein